MSVCDKEKREVSDLSKLVGLQKRYPKGGILDKRWQRIIQLLTTWLKEWKRFQSSWSIRRGKNNDITPCAHRWLRRGEQPPKDDDEPCHEF